MTNNSCFDKTETPLAVKSQISSAVLGLKKM
jgi:hypothetical protein